MGELGRPHNVALGVAGALRVRRRADRGELENSTADFVSRVK